MKYLIPLILSFAPVFLFAQLSITVEVQDATCSSNGQITIIASGGSGSYTYSITNDCDDFFPPQASNVFTTLPPCDYSVSVTDQATNMVVSETVTIMALYETMNLSLEFVNCEIIINVEGGNMPFVYSYGTEGVNGSFTDNQPPSSNIFSDLPEGFFWFQVTDDCGNTTNTTGNTSTSDIQSFTRQQSQNGLQITPNGGNPPYAYSLTSDAGTFQNETGLFPWNQIGCNPYITITDQCSYSELSNRPVEINVNGSVECVNFSQGTALLTPSPGIAPFLFIVETPEGVFTFNDGNIEGLPPNLAYYDFYIEDACGDRKLLRYTTRLKPAFEPTYNGCGDYEISFMVERQCSGPFYPLTVTCMNCSELDAVEVVFSSQNIEFSNYLPGEWDILIVDQICGDSTRCQDELFLELTPACDSIQALVIDRFICDNGVISRRVIFDTTTTFTLRDINGTVIEEGNTTGIFNGVPLGQYEVTAYLDCDTLINQILLEEAIEINPYYETRVGYYDNGDGCRYHYSLDIEKGLGPFILTDGADESFYEILNNYGEDNCRFYAVNGLPPGIYTLTSLSRCGEIIIELPDLPFNEIEGVIIESSCPNNVEIRVEGELNSAGEWLSLFSPYNLNIQDFTKRDRYKIGSSYYDSNIITGLEPGNHTVYIYPMSNTSCPTDSFSFFIPEYEPVNLQVSGYILCDDSATTDMVLKISDGNAPYLLKEIDCNASSTLIDSYQLDSLQELSFSNLGPGSHCYVIRDACGISSDFQESIRYYDDEIQLEYLCDSTILLSVDSLSIPIFWKDESGEIIASGHYANPSVPATDAVFLLEIELPTCTVLRGIEVPNRSITPTLTLTPSGIDTLFVCGEELQEVTILTNAENILWTTGEVSNQIYLNETGQYSVEVENDLGCTHADTIEVLNIPLPNPEILGDSGFCADTFAILNLNQPFYGITWSNNSTADSLSVTEGNTYWVEVSNRYTCSQRDTFSIEQWPLPIIAIEGDTLICPNTTTEIQANQVFPYYLWSTGESTSSIEVTPGGYGLSVTDEYQCSNSVQLTIIELPEITAQIDGDTTICKGGEANIFFSLSGSNEEAAVFLDSSAVISPFPLNLNANDTFLYTFNTSTILRLASIEIENYDCPIQTFGEAGVLVNQEETLFDITQVSCKDNADAGILANPQSYTPPFEYQWSTGYQEAQLTGLPVGVYILTVTDGLECTWIDTVWINEPAEMSVSLSTNNPLCYNEQTGIIALDQVAGGTAPFIASINDSQFFSVPFETMPLSSGGYHLMVTDNNNCKWDTLLNLINPPELIIILAEDAQIQMGDDFSINALVNSNSIDIWEWTNLSTQELIDTSEQSINVAPLQTTAYQVNVINGYGCKAIDDIIIYVDTEIPLFIPNAFSPNGDGVNDYFNFFTGTSNALKKVTNFQIFNRWGNQVFSNKNLHVNTPSSGWDGMFNGKKAALDIYTYFIELEMINGQKKELSGDVLLLR